MSYFYLFSWIYWLRVIQEPMINTYANFRDEVLPRIKRLGYNAVQIMAIQEHSYYASFGYFPYRSHFISSLSMSVVWWFAINMHLLILYLHTLCSGLADWDWWIYKVLSIWCRYHVTNFFAPSSRCGTPDDLKSLIDSAHELGLLVLMDIVHRY